MGWVNHYSLLHWIILGHLKFLKLINYITINPSQSHCGCSHSLRIPVMPNAPSNICKQLCQVWNFLCQNSLEQVTETYQFFCQERSTLLNSHQTIFTSGQPQNMNGILVSLQQQSQREFTMMFLFNKFIFFLQGIIRCSPDEVPDFIRHI